MRCRPERAVLFTLYPTTNTVQPGTQAPHVRAAQLIFPGANCSCLLPCLPTTLSSHPLPHPSCSRPVDLPHLRPRGVRAVPRIPCCDALAGVPCAGRPQSPLSACMAGSPAPARQRPKAACRLLPGRFCLPSLLPAPEPAPLPPLLPDVWARLRAGAGDAAGVGLRQRLICAQVHPFSR